MILVKNIIKYFEINNKKIKVLNDISIKVEKGEEIAIIGPSGSGKSTFLRCLNRLEKVTSGLIFFKNEDITKKTCDINKLRQNIGMVFQNFNLFPHMNVLENITFAPKKLGLLSKNEAKNKAIQLLSKVGLEAKADSSILSLSGGQKQRIAIVRALIMNPDVMLFDEPTSALDPENIREVLNVIKELAKEKMTFLLVTHEMAFAKEVASRILFFDQGAMIQDSSPNKMFNNPEHQRIKDFFDKVL